MGVLQVILVVLLVLLPLYLFSKNRKQRKRIAKALDKFGGPPWYPIVGTNLALVMTPKKDLYELIFQRNEKYGPVFRTYMGTLPVLHLMKAEHLEIVLKSNINIRKATSYNFIKPWLGEGLITASGKKWQTHRKLITPTFHFKILDSFIEVFSEKSQKLAQQLLTRANGEFFDIHPYVTRCALDILCETAMGVEINAMESTPDYVQSIYDISEIFVERVFHPYLHPDIIFYNCSKGTKQKEVLNILHSFTSKVIAEKKALLEKAENGNRKEQSKEDILLGKKQRMAFLDLLLESNKNNWNKITDDEIREEVDTFMFAGHDTTTGATCWTLFALGNYPEIQERVHQELDSVFHGEERPITPDDINQLQYLDRVIKETLRFHTLVPVILRSLTEDIVIDGTAIPPGVTIAMHIRNLHHDPDQYEDPRRFDPDRFLPENVAKRHPYSYLPFSAGPRNCIGQKFGTRNTKTMLASILRKYKVKSRDDPHTIKCFGDIVVRPQEGMFLALEVRNP